MNAYNYGPYGYNSTNPMPYNKQNINFQTRRLITEVFLDHRPTISDQTLSSKRSESLTLNYHHNANKGLLIMPSNKTEIYKKQHQAYQ